ncbi:MAG: hypothetical protein DHS20C18_25130 [Saprospiraceae bacterium]|nr:MAG: hypothetical protein DHS20C18_25130 [Saprospiraceae bacterium]
MSAKYEAILWNPQKRNYDLILWGLILLYFVLFSVFQAIFHPTFTPETLLIRGTGTLALLMLHIILVIGPLCRINAQFLPLLYNRRHLGVSMFLIAAVHGIFSILQFHLLGNVNPLISIFTSNGQYDSLAQFPFQVLGFFALIILFLMAVSSHDFWLKNLGPRFWKSMHMLVYIAYGLIISHVLLGVIQVEDSPVLITLLGVGMLTIIGLHIYAAILERRREQQLTKLDQEGFMWVGEVDDIAEDRAKVVFAAGENIAIFKSSGKFYAVNNVCKHQNGPLGEGKIVDGCITCPWHGYQYLPETGQAPPPFTEKVSTYTVKVIDQQVWVNPKPLPEDTRVEV